MKTSITTFLAPEETTGAAIEAASTTVWNDPATRRADLMAVIHEIALSAVSQPIEARVRVLGEGGAA